MSEVVWVDDGVGPAVVLLHAFPCDHSMWSGQVEPLVAAGWRVLVPDLPGFGSSALPADRPSLTVVVETLARSLLARSVDRCVLVGLSVGGYLIMEWLRRHPEMVAAVVLCDTKASADAPQAQAGRLDMATMVEADPAACGPLLRERLLPVIVGESTLANRPPVVEAVSGWMDTARPATVAWYQRAMAERPDSMDVLREFELPALVIWGDQDAMSPRAEQDAMVGVLRDTRLAVIPEAGHLSAFENPDAVSRALVDFLAGVRRVSIDG